MMTPQDKRNLGLTLTALINEANAQREIQKSMLKTTGETIDIIRKMYLELDGKNEAIKNSTEQIKNDLNSTEAKVTSVDARLHNYMEDNPSGPPKT